MGNPGNDDTASGAKAWLKARFRESWAAARRWQRFYVVLAGGGLALFWFGDVVFWFENGYSFVDGAITPSRIDENSPVPALESFLFVAPGLILLESSLGLDRPKAAKLSHRLLGAYMALVSLGLVYFYTQTSHPLALIPAVLILAGGGAWFADFRGTRS